MKTKFDEKKSNDVLNYFNQGYLDQSGVVKFATNSGNPNPLLVGNLSASNKGTFMTPKKAAVIMKRMMAVCMLAYKKNQNFVNFLTFTIPVIKHDSSDDIEIQRRSYKLFSRILSRLVSETGMNYCWVAEIQEKRNMIHYHVLCDASYIDYKALSILWEKMNKGVENKNSVHGEKVYLDCGFDLVGYFTKNAQKQGGSNLVAYFYKGSKMPIYGRIFGSSQNLVKNVVLPKEVLVELLLKNSLSIWQITTSDNYNVIYGKYYGNFIQLAKIFTSFER